MTKYKPQRSITPTKFQSGTVYHQGVSLAYSESGIVIRNKRSDEKLLDATWQEVSSVSVVLNTPMLGAVHFILVLIFLQSIIGAIFFPHILFHLFYKTTIKWAGFIEFSLNTGHVVKLTPTGWTRLGFHIGEAQLTYNTMKAYSPDLEIVIIDAKDYK